MLGQALLTKRMGKTRVIAETGAGQHGVATATAAALFGLECVVYMGEVDTERQALNVARMRLLGAEVIPVDHRLAHAQGRDQRGDARLGHQRRHDQLPVRHGRRPAPVPARWCASSTGSSATRPAPRCSSGSAGCPTSVAACVGGGSNAIGIFTAFIGDPSVRLVGLEAGGDGVETGRHAATITGGAPGVLHGARSYLLQDENGQTIESHSISAGLDYPGVGPEHAYLHDIGRAEYRPITDAEAMAAFALLCRTEGIIPAIESAHALAGALCSSAANSGPDAVILVNLSGRGDKDVETAAAVLRHESSRDARSPKAPGAPARGREPRRADRLPAGRLPDVPTSRSRRCGRWSRAASTSSRSACPTATR